MPLNGMPPHKMSSGCTTPPIACPLHSLLTRSCRAHAKYQCSLFCCSCLHFSEASVSNHDPPKVTAAAPPGSVLLGHGSGSLHLKDSQRAEHANRFLTRSSQAPLQCGLQRGLISAIETKLDVRIRNDRQ